MGSIVQRKCHVQIVLPVRVIVEREGKTAGEGGIWVLIEVFKGLVRYMMSANRALVGFMSGYDVGKSGSCRAHVRL